MDDGRDSADPGPRVARSISRHNVQAKLGPDEAMLEYVLVTNVIRLGDHCEISQNLRLGQRAAVDDKIDSYLSDISKLRADKQAAHFLYAMLLEPVGQSASKAHLILIQDGKLNLLPWNALVDNSNRYLVETADISVAPSVSSAILLRGKLPIKSAKTLLAVGGLPYHTSGPLVASIRGAYPSGTLPNLPSARNTALSILRYMRWPIPPTLITRPYSFSVIKAAEQMGRLIRRKS